MVPRLNERPKRRFEFVAGNLHQISGSTASAAQGNRVRDLHQALYRDAQLPLRAIVGVRELDQFLTDKDALAKGLEEIVRRRVAALGLEIVSAGIRDVILPGDMKDLMNKGTEAS